MITALQDCLPSPRESGNVGTLCPRGPDSHPTMEPGGNGSGVPLEASSARQLLLLKPADDDFPGARTQRALPSPAGKRGGVGESGREEAEDGGVQEGRRREQEGEGKRGEEEDHWEKDLAWCPHSCPWGGLNEPGDSKALCRL